jgi:tRNA A-37 threonylcarbamoyl transferase component Bud32
MTDNVLQCEQLLRNLPGKRLVCRGIWQRRAVLVKLFIDPKSARRYWGREKAGAEALKGARVSTPALLFSGQTDDGIPVLVFEFLPESQTALEVWNGLSTSAERTAFLSQLIELLVGLHEAGLVHEDLHLQNFLSSGQKIYAIDGDAVCARGCGKALGHDASCSNLLTLLAQLPPQFDPLAEAMTRHYAQLRNFPASQLVCAMEQSLPQVRRRRRRKYVAKCYRTCSEFVRSHGHGQVAICRREAQGEALDSFLNDPDAFMQSGEMLKDGNSSTVVRVKGHGIDWVVKRYNIKSPWHALSRGFRPTRAWASWGNAHRLKISGIATPGAVVLLEKRFGPLRSTGYYVSEYLQGTHAEVFFDDKNVSSALKEQAAGEFVTLFGLFRKLGIVHGDCKADNFLIRNNILWVLDLDAMRECFFAAHFQSLYRVDRQRFLNNWQSQPEWLRWFDEQLDR